MRSLKAHLKNGIITRANVLSNVVYYGVDKQAPTQSKYDLVYARATGVHAGHSVRGEVSPPTKLGIHGTQAAVDQDLCNGDAVCVSVCPARARSNGEN